MPRTRDDRRRPNRRGGRRPRAHGRRAEGLLIEGVARSRSGVGGAAVTGLADAWGKLDPAARAAAIAAANVAGDAGGHPRRGRAAGPLRSRPRRPARTPLEIIRSLRREATEVLRTAGVPEVVRDPFETRAFPDDVYGIVIKSPAELGDDELGGALLVWGLGKAKVLRSRGRRAAMGLEAVRPEAEW